MARGTPDWSLSPYDIHILREDLAELAARLGSIVVYDRRGNVMWWDDFGKGKSKWEERTSGAGAAIALTTSYPKWGAYCCKLTAGSDLAHQAELRGYQSGYGGGALGLEVSVGFTSSFDAFELTLRYCDGANSHTAIVGLDETNSRVYYRDTSGTAQELGTLNVRKDADANYNTVKLVADFTEDKYVRLMVNSDNYVLSAYDSPSGVDTTGQHVYLEITFSGRTGYNDYCLVDGIILTQGEA